MCEVLLVSNQPGSHLPTKLHQTSIGCVDVYKPHQGTFIEALVPMNSWVPLGAATVCSHCNALLLSNEEHFHHQYQEMKHRFSSFSAESPPDPFSSNPDPAQASHSLGKKSKPSQSPNTAGNVFRANVAQTAVAKRKIVHRNQFSAPIAKHPLELSEN